MNGRPPNQLDVKRMKEAVALVTAYDLGVETNDFSTYLELAKETSEGMTQGLSQLAWLFLQAMENSGIPKYKVLDWYGYKFAVKHEEMKE